MQVRIWTFYRTFTWWNAFLPWKPWRGAIAHASKFPVRAMQLQDLCRSMICELLRFLTGCFSLQSPAYDRSASVNEWERERDYERDRDRELDRERERERLQEREERKERKRYSGVRRFLWFSLRKLWRHTCYIHLSAIWLVCGQYVHASRGYRGLFLFIISGTHGWTCRAYQAL